MVKKSMRIAVKSNDDINVVLTGEGDKFMINKIFTLIELLTDVSSWQETPYPES